MAETKKLDFYIRSDLFRVGVDEDGEDYIAETFYIIAEDPKGNRYISPERFPGGIRTN